MNTSKRKHLGKKGWKFGTANEFLKLSAEESAFVELKLALSRNFHEYRKEKKLTQEQTARLLKSSQSRIAKLEAGDPSVSLDLLVRSLLQMGATRKNLAQMLS